MFEENKRSIKYIQNHNHHTSHLICSKNSRKINFIIKKVSRTYTCAVYNAPVSRKLLQCITLSYLIL